MRLEKYHGLGNDFLILLDADGTNPIDEQLTRRLCDRHRGVGADGLIRVTPGTDADLTMELRNADGGPAEISGNGMRCVALAALDGKLAAGPEFTVRSADRIYKIRVGEDDMVSVDMGPALVSAERPFDTAGWRAREVDLGNPHLVLLCPDPASVHVAELGAHLEKLRPGGLNIEFVAPGPERNALTVRLWERGAGETEASGSGSCAAAAAAHAWGLVGRRVTVHNPGGDLEVDVGEDAVLLTGPAEHVATVEIAS
jgi:diaminopimelate epimerase